ncbi:MmgE/PrpD family protein [Natronorubrum texcoconense]|uniref:2-methylcitrate dehydratase PrpD n=1 Tax=Natronorubrum texcoconense TaxID=1095776 RepID=A0A1G9D2S0_9EURY|nr:MmgE/PrpD family protein [Natronorubrum texcoconense]SDK58232.1 2-methylcitrate dehydratase PrpD [Natronorubrum texcoconense]
MTAPSPLSTFVATLSSDALPSDVRDRAGLVIADTIGSIVAGSTTEPVRTLQARYAARGSGPASVLGTNSSLPIEQAATLNGTAGTVLELDEGHKRAAGHPSIHVLPAVLAVAEADDGSGEDLLAAFVAGYETAARVAQACQPLADGYHPHGVWGVVGAAAGVANYRSLEAETVANALSIAANHAQHTRFEAALEGASVRDTYAGMVAPDAIRAVDQAQAGFTGLEDGVRRHLESVTDGAISTISADDFGEEWELCNGYFKIHAACRYTHPVLDAIDELEDETALELTAIDSIAVETYPAAAGLGEQAPQTRLEAKFSIPFVIATRLVHGHAGKDAFEPAAFKEEVFELATRVTVNARSEFADALPDSRGARVTIEHGETESTITVDHARGGGTRPFNESRLHEKFDSLVTPVLGDSAAERTWALLRSEGMPDARTLCESVTP